MSPRGSSVTGRLSSWYFDRNSGKQQGCKMQNYVSVAIESGAKSELHEKKNANFLAAPFFLATMMVFPKAVTMFT